MVRLSSLLIYLICSREQVEQLAEKFKASGKSPAVIFNDMLQESEKHKEDVENRHMMWLNEKQKKVDHYHEHAQELEKERKHYEEMLKNLNERAR